MRAIVDSDPLIYKIGFGNDDMPLHYQCKMLSYFIDNMLDDIGATDQVFYLSGKDNFRVKVATILPYKGNRDSSHRPRYYNELRAFLVEVYNAILVDGMEADDACGIDAYDCIYNDTPYVICSIDKDLLMLEGDHYNYNRKELCHVDMLEGWRFFYTQCLTGDVSDNIPGLYKLTGSKATKKIKQPLQEFETPEEMDDYVYETYLDLGATKKEVDEIKELLWIRRA